MSSVSNREVAKVFIQAADRAASAKNINELINLIQKVCKEAKEKAYVYAGQTCLSCKHFERDGSTMSGRCRVKLVKDYWSSGSLVMKYVSQSEGQKCKKYEQLAQNELV